MGIKKLIRDSNKIEVLPHFCTKEDKNNVLWASKDGYKYYCICEIRTDHLSNIVAYMIRKGKSQDPRVDLFINEVNRRSGKKTKTGNYPLEDNYVNSSIKELGRKIRLNE